MITVDSAPLTPWYRLLRYWYPLAFFQDVKGSPWERAAAWQHNLAHRHLLVDTLLRWWALGVWMVVIGDRLQHDWGLPMLARLPLCGGAILLAMSATPLAAYLLLGKGHA